MTTSYNGPADRFTLFSNIIHDKSGKPDRAGQMWAVSEWPVDEIMALANWAANEAEKFKNRKGQVCVKVQQNFYPKQSEAGNSYLLGVTKDHKPKREARPAPGLRLPGSEDRIDALLNEDIPF